MIMVSMIPQSLKYLRKVCHNMAIKSIDEVKSFLKALPELLDSEDA